MSNQLLNIIAKDNEIIPYRKELNAITGSITATILLQQIMYWYAKNDYKAFYKFIEPCNHEKYIEGDSWCEELGFSRKEFISAIKKLEENGYVYKKTNGQRVTYYSLNLKQLENALTKTYQNAKMEFSEEVNEHKAKCPKGILLNAKRGFTKMPKGDLHYKDTENTTENNIYVESKDSDNNKTLKRKKINYSDNFEIIWQEYDKKTGSKERAYKLYQKKYKNIDIKLIIEAIKTYKNLKEEWRDLKDFDGFLNGMIDIYLPKRAWIIDRNCTKHLGHFYDAENKFISDEQKELKLESVNIATYIKEKRFGYIA